MKLFNNIGIFGNFDSDAVVSVSDKITSILEQKEINHQKYPSSFGSDAQSTGIDNQNLDLVIAVGGDGTFMNVARQRAGCDAPLLGVNLGRRGFLTDVAVRQIDDCLNQLLLGNYRTETRILIEVTTQTDELNKRSPFFTALNDIVVHKTNFGRLLDFNITIDDEFVTALRADGIIVATPTGATAYALSAGGPVLYPSLPAIELVPIAPHTLTQRPIVINDSSRIVIEVSSGEPGSASLVVDGHIRQGLQGNEKILVRRSDLTVDLVRIEGHTFYNALRQKLSWGT